MKLFNLMIVFYLLSCKTNTFGQSITISTPTDTLYNQEDLFEDDPYFWSHTSEIGVNFTPLISKLVPFNLGQNEAGLIGFTWKKYFSKRAFRVNFGANVESNIIGRNFIYLSLGTEKRYPLTKDKKFFYTSSWSFFGSLEDENNQSFFGISKGYGFEYHPTKRIFFSTEAQLELGLDADEGGFVVNFLIPVAIFVNIRLY